LYCSSKSSSLSFASVTQSKKRIIKAILITPVSEQNPQSKIKKEPNVLKKKPNLNQRIFFIKRATARIVLNYTHLSKAIWREHS
jgi:hypothetical protein